MKRALFAVGVFLALTGCFLAAGSGEKADDLALGFHSPPDSAKPWAYWWWLNGNVSKVGITKDLEEMKRQGIYRFEPCGVYFLNKLPCRQP